MPWIPSMQHSCSQNLQSYCDPNGCFPRDHIDYEQCLRKSFGRNWGSGDDDENHTNFGEMTAHGIWYSYLRGMRCSVSVPVERAVTTTLLFPIGRFLMSAHALFARALFPIPLSPIRKTIELVAPSGFSKMALAAAIMARFSSFRPVKGIVDFFFFVTATASDGSRIGTGLSYPLALTGGRLLKTKRLSACALTASSTRMPLLP